MALFGNLFGKKESGAGSLKNAAAGQYVDFGVFPQGKDGKKLTPVSWLVLEKKGSRLLLISRYALACRQFNTAKTTWDGTIGWEKSSLRAWLNGEYLDRFFSPEEKALITESDVPADPNPDFKDITPGNATKDKVFLLSIREAEKYFPNDEARKCPLTKFALACGAWSPDKDNQPCGRWWLRTPGYNQNRNACVECSGNILTGGNEVDDDTSCCIRPAIWVDAG